MTSPKTVFAFSDWSSLKTATPKRFYFYLNFWIPVLDSYFLLFKRWPFYLSDQFKRAMTSVILNISEGNGRQMPRDRKRFFNIATASAKESASVLDIACSFNLISKGKCYEIQDNLLQVVKMVRKLP